MSRPCKLFGGTCSCPEGPGFQCIAATRIRYCPECGSVGGNKDRRCCPDRGKAAFIPEEIARQARAGFMVSISSLPDRIENLSTLLREVSNGLGFSESWSQRVAQALKK